MRKIFSLSAFGLLPLILLWSSCEEDNLETLIKNNECDTCQSVVCDTTFTISYANDIRAITLKYCDKCHSALNAPIYGNGNILDIHSGLADRAASGTLTCVINHGVDCPPMPKDDPKLSDCNIARIEAWVRQGYPNN